MGFFLAIDIGTEGARAGVFDERGARLGDASSGYATRYPRPGWAEQDPDDWWRAAVLAARSALAQAGASRVEAVGVATTASTVVALDEHDAPVRPAILWMDSRASRESQETAEVDHPAMRFAGGADSAEWLVPKAMWLARHEPEEYRRAVRIGESVDYLNLRLTGRWFGSRMNATCKWNFDHREGALPADLYAMLGVGDLAQRLPQEIHATGAPAATLSAQAARELGIAPGATVISGGIDAHLAIVALWGLSAQPVAVVAGTSNAFIAELEEPVFAPTIWGPYPGALREDRWLVEGGQISAGASLAWLSERVLGVPREQLPALVERASAVPPASHGLLMLDHFMGNRTPLKDPKLRGAMLGLSLGTTPEHLYRAAVEAVCFGTRQVLDSFEDVGVDISDVYFTGGIRHNRLWAQTTADALGRPIGLAEGENLTTRAIGLLSVAATTGEDVQSIAARFAPVCRTIEPDPLAVAPLREAYESYLEATALVAGISARLADVASGQRSAEAR